MMARCSEHEICMSDVMSLQPTHPSLTSMQAVILSDVMSGGVGINSGMYDEAKQAWVNFGGCFFGVILASLFG